MRNNNRMRVLLNLGLLVVLLFLAFAFQGSRGIYAPDEGFYVSIAQSMLENNDFLIPRLQKDIWLDKPPLSIWGIAAGLHLFGLNEWGARFFHALCFVLTDLLVFFIGCSLSNKRLGLIAAIIYATMLIPLVASNVVTPDMPLALWTTAAFLCFWNSIKPNASHIVIWKMLMCITFGFGFLTKGPAVLIPSGSMYVFLLLEKRVVKYFLTPWAVLGMCLFAGLGLGWYVYVSRNIPGAYNYFFDNQIWGRTISSKYGRNPGLVGALIYAPVILFGALPWSFYWIKPLSRNRKKIFRQSFWLGLKSKPQYLLLACWIGISMLILCAASSKLPLYALPVFPALALVTAYLLPVESTRQLWCRNSLGFSQKLIVSLMIWAIVLVGIKGLSGYYSSKKDMRALYLAIESKLPTTEYEIVAVKDHLEGLGFYHVSFVERVTTKDIPYPFFILPEHLTEEVEEMKYSDIIHLLICRKKRRAKYVREALVKANIPFQEVILPFKRYLFTVLPEAQRTVTVTEFLNEHFRVQAERTQSDQISMRVDQGSLQANMKYKPNPNSQQ